MNRQILASDNITYSGCVLASIENIIVTFKDDVLSLSIDCGKSYCKHLDISGVDKIMFIHVFKDTYNLLFCTHQKAYYSTDWEAFSESTVKDIDGSTFIPTTYNNFTPATRIGIRQVLDGKELLCWGNYTFLDDTEYVNINIWYTVDDGKNIKSCFKFGTSKPSGEVAALSARHIHAVSFNPMDSTFWCQTGDETTTTYSHWLKGTYNINTDIWAWELIASGDDFKTVNMIFIGEYVYWSVDIGLGGMKRCLYTQMGDESKHEVIFRDGYPSAGVYIGERGDFMSISPEHDINLPDAAVMHYSLDNGVSINPITGIILGENVFYDTWYEPNTNNKILAVVENEQGKVYSVWLDDMLKRAGFPDAFKPLP